MLLRIFIYVVTVLLSLSVLAQERSLFDSQSELDLQVQLNETQGGMPEAPVIPCPRPNPKYSNLLNQLTEIKTKIKSETCKEAQLTVENLGLLLGDDRKEFLKLVDQGLFGEGQLDAGQVKKVETYVSNIVNTAAQVTGAANNPGCFDDDDKDITLAYVSSVISEVSGAVGALAGPFGAKISLGGKIAGSLLSSVGEIVTARETYDYSKIEHINNYFENLCTYHDFKADLDVESDLVTRRRRLALIYKRANEYILKVGEVCESCIDVVQQFETIERNRIAIDPQSPQKVSGGQPKRSTNQFVTVVETDPSNESFDGNVEEALNRVSKTSVDDLTNNPVANITYSQLSQYFKVVNRNAIQADIDTMASYDKSIQQQDDIGLEDTPVVEPVIISEETDGFSWWPWQKRRSSVIIRGFSLDDLERDPFQLAPVLTEGPKIQVPLLDPVDATIRALLIRSWARDQVIITEHNWRQGAGEDGRDFVAALQEDIEKFLVNREAKRYIKSITQDLKNAINDLKSETLSYLSQIDPREHHSSFVPTEKYSPFYLDSYQDASVRGIGVAFHHLFKNEIEFTNILKQIETQNSPGIDSSLWVGDRRGLTRQELLETKNVFIKQFTSMASKFHIVYKKCTFFSQSYFSDNRAISRACEQATEQLRVAKSLAKAIKETAFVVVGGFALEHMFEPTPIYVRDFIASVNKAITRDLDHLNENLRGFREWNKSDDEQDYPDDLLDQLGRVGDTHSHITVEDPKNGVVVIPTIEAEEFLKQHDE